MTAPQQPAAGQDGRRRAGDVPGPPPPSLRERKKAAAMRRIQETALDLFARHGFDQVTIEQVAAAADASPSTVYRYFGTKEGLVLHDEYDDRALDGLAHYLHQGLAPWAAAEAALGLVEEAHFAVEEDSTRQRLQLFFDNPSVRSAAYLMVDDTIDQLARTMAATGRWSFAQGRVVASVIVWPFIAAVKNWHESDDRPWREHLADAIATMRTLVN